MDKGPLVSPHVVAGTELGMTALLGTIIAVAGVDFGVFDILVIIAAILFIGELLVSPAVTRGKVIQNIAWAVFALSFIFLTP